VRAPTPRLAAQQRERESSHTRNRLEKLYRERERERAGGGRGGRVIIRPDGATVRKRTNADRFPYLPITLLFTCPSLPRTR
jgi:hypothetical protein